MSTKMRSSWRIYASNRYRWMLFVHKYRVKVADLFDFPRNTVRVVLRLLYGTFLFFHDDTWPRTPGRADETGMVTSRELCTN